MDKGEKMAEDLNWLYRYIRYMSKRIQDNECMNFVQPAFKIATGLKEAWDAIPQKTQKLIITFLIVFLSVKVII